MISAFGVDHGEVSKNLGFNDSPLGIGYNTGRIMRGTGVSAGSVRRLGSGNYADQLLREGKAMASQARRGKADGAKKHFNFGYHVGQNQHRYLTGAAVTGAAGTGVLAGRATKRNKKT